MKMDLPKLGLPLLLAASLSMAGCATQPYGNTSGVSYSQGNPAGQGGSQARCQNCGVVQEINQVQVSGGSGSGGTWGAVIGAVAGGLLGNTVGKGDGRKAATVAGAVAGGAVGNQVGKNQGGSDMGWRVVVRLDDGRYATVTQRDNPGVRSGDYVQVRNDRVYAM